jgi:hypothetical protein
MLNATGVYIGENQSWIQYLQFLAKIADIFIIASITTVVFEYAHSELSCHDMPFGAVFSGFQVTAPNYL